MTSARQHQSSCNTGSAMQILFWEQQTRIHPFSSARAAVYIFRWYLSCCQGALPRLTPRKSSLWRHNEAMKTAGVDWRHGSSVQWFKKTHCTGAVTIWASISSGTVVGLVVLDSLRSLAGGGCSLSMLMMSLGFPLQWMQLSFCWECQTSSHTPLCSLGLVFVKHGWEVPTSLCNVQFYTYTGDLVRWSRPGVQIICTLLQ